MIDLSIIIVTFNTKKLIKECLESVITHTSGIKLEIIVVDNDSKDGSVAMLRTDFSKENVKVVSLNKNYGFAAANNIGVKEAKGKYLLFLNSDTLISDNVLGEMVKYMDKHPKIGISSCALLNADGTIQGTGGYFPTLLSVFSWMTIQDIPFVDSIIKPFHPMHAKSFTKGTSFYKTSKELDWVTGAYMLVRSKVIEDVGLWDEEYFMYTEEVDLCFRAKKRGWKVWYLPKWNIVHLGGASSTKEFSILSEYKGVKRFYKKFYPVWQYPLLRILLKVGALGRMVVFGILEGRKAVQIYGKAFKFA